MNIKKIKLFYYEDFPVRFGIHVGDKPVICVSEICVVRQRRVTGMMVSGCAILTGELRYKISCPLLT